MPRKIGRYAVAQSHESGQCTLEVGDDLQQLLNADKGSWTPEEVLDLDSGELRAVETVFSVQETVFATMTIREVRTEDICAVFKEHARYGSDLAAQEASQVTPEQRAAIAHILGTSLLLDSDSDYLPELTDAMIAIGLIE